MMKQRLALTSDTDERTDRALTEFVIHCHLNVAWYRRRIAWQKVGRAGFYALSVALLMGLPFAAIYIASQADDATWMTALLTGVLALHRTLQTLIENRKQRALFGKASADMQQVLYTLEDKWEGKVLQDRDAFLDDLSAATAACRKIAEDEKQAYYAKEANPAIDLSQAVSTAGQNAAALIANVKVPDRVAKARAAETTRSEKEVLVATLESLLERKREEYARLSDDDPSKKAMAGAIEQIASGREAAMLERAKAEATLEVHGARK